MSESIETVECEVISETEKAYLLRDRFTAGRSDYFPKSQVSFKRRNIKTGEAIAEIPMWLIKSKGWDT